MRSLPENSATNRSLSGCAASEIDRQPQARRPAFRALVQAGDGRVAELHPGRLEQPAGLLQREAEIVAADLQEIPGEAEAVKPEPGIHTRRQHDQQLRRHPRQGVLEPPERVRRAKLVQVVDDQHHRLVERVEAREQRLDHALRAERRRGADALDQPLVRPRRPGRR